MKTLQIDKNTAIVPAHIAQVRVSMDWQSVAWTVNVTLHSGSVLKVGYFNYGNYEPYAESDYSFGMFVPSSEDAAKEAELKARELAASIVEAIEHS
jgi:hypothetical protein